MNNGTGSVKIREDGDDGTVQNRSERHAGLEKTDETTSASRSSKLGVLELTDSDLKVEGGERGWRGARDRGGLCRFGSCEKRMANRKEGRHENKGRR